MGRGVIARERGRSSIPEALVIDREVTAYWTPLSRGMTSIIYFVAFFPRPLPSASSALRTVSNSCSEALSARGNRKFSVSSVLTIAEPITTRANHL